MAVTNLDEKIREAGGAVPMLRNAPGGPPDFPMRPEFSNWRDEQRAWATTAVVFDQSHHMTDVNFRGPDVMRLLSDVGVNTLANFGKNRAKQYVACNQDGYVVGDGILFGLEDSEVSLVGGAMLSRWVQYQAETGGYDVEVTRDERTSENDSRAPHSIAGRKYFRYQVQGPLSLRIVEAAADGALPAVKPFHIGSLMIGGCAVRALNHSMSRRSGLEIWGTGQDRDEVWARLTEAGEPFGLRPAGAMAYSTTALESGWWGVELPAIYSGVSMEAYRKWVGVDTVEATGSIGGSFASENIEDYYVTPWDIGLGSNVKFDHEFIGRSALERSGENPRRRKVWLRWNDEDVTRVMAESFFASSELRAKFMMTPNATYSTWHADAVLQGDRLIGISAKAGYTVNVGGWSSIATVESELAYDGAAVMICWGEESGGTAKPGVERHVQAKIRATVSTSPLVPAHHE